MRKLLILTCFSSIAMASSLNMNNLYCKKYKLTSTTTLADVQSNCTIKKQATEKGMYQVELTNDATQKEVSCNFTNNQPTAVLNSCK